MWGIYKGLLVWLVPKELQGPQDLQVLQDLRGQLGHKVHKDHKV
jgi:hypothetical protein